MTSTDEPTIDDDEVAVEPEADEPEAPAPRSYFGAAKRPSLLQKQAQREEYVPQVQSPELQRIHETVPLVPTKVRTRDLVRNVTTTEDLADPVVGEDVVDFEPSEPAANRS